MEDEKDTTQLSIVMTMAIVPVFFVLAGLCVGLTVLIYYLTTLSA